MHHDQQKISANDFWDRTGAAISWACAAHCLAMPFAVSFLPLFGLGFLAHECFEYLFIGLSVVVASISLLPGFFKYHRNIGTLLLFGGGIALVICADRLFEENFAGKVIFVIIGAVFITSAHFLNRYLCKKCPGCQKSACRSLT